KPNATSKLFHFETRLATQFGAPFVSNPQRSSIARRPSSRFMGDTPSHMAGYCGKRGISLGIFEGNCPFRCRRRSCHSSTPTRMVKHAGDPKFSAVLPREAAII